MSETKRELVECTECDGSGIETTLRNDPTTNTPPDTLDDIIETTVNCRRCGGRGTEFDGLGCPRCGADEDTLSSSLIPSGSYKQSCSDCPWWDSVG